MKTRTIVLAIVAVLGVSALACGGSGYALQKQQSAGKIGCLPAQVKMVGEPDVQVNYLTNDIHSTWIAECVGQRYVCTANQPNWGPADVQCSKYVGDEEVSPEPSTTEGR